MKRGEVSGAALRVVTAARARTTGLGRRATVRPAGGVRARSVGGSGPGRAVRTGRLSVVSGMLPGVIRVDVRPAVSEVERLYLAAGSGPPLREGPETATLFAALYGRLLARDGLLVVTASVDGELAGIAYGHPWHWAEQSGDAWARLLRRRLGDRACDLIEGTLAVYLLAVHPTHQGRGWGRGLFRRLLDLGGPRAWLQTTDVDSPALRLYRSLGWHSLGWGPDAPDGRPGLIMASPQVGHP